MENYILPPTLGGGSPETFFALLISDSELRDGEGVSCAELLPVASVTLGGRPQARPNGGNGNADGL